MKTAPVLRGGRALLLGVLALALLPTVALAAGENYGRVAGYVFDTTGNPLAEISVHLKGPALQQPATATTDRSGRFEFSAVPPGEGYEVEAQMTGFRPVRQTNVAVHLGQTTPVDFLLELATDSEMTETVVVVGKNNPALNPDSAQTGAVMSSEKAVATPIFTQVQAIPQLIAGVGPGNMPSTRGGLSRWGKQYVDGMETTDVTDGSISAPLNFFAVDQFEVITGGMDAQYNALGMVQNVVTKTGSNRFTYDATLILSPSFSNMKSQVPSRQGGQVGNLTNSNTPQAETSFYSPILNFGGPIVKDRLWFYVSTQLNLSHRETPISGTENRPTDTQTRIGRLKLTWQPTAQDRLSLALNLDRNTITNTIARDTVTLDAEQQIKRGGYFLIANYDRAFTEDVRLQLQTGVTWKDAYFGPMPGASGISHTDLDAGITRFGAPRMSSSEEGNFTREGKMRFQFDPTLHFKLGSHTMKTGVQLGLLTGRETTGVVGNQRFLNNGPFCDPADPTTHAACSVRVDFYNTEGEQAPQVNDASVQTVGAFFQDRWNVTRQLTLVGGLRFDMGRLFGDDGKYLGRLNGWGPRLSATYDLFGDRTTLVQAHYGRSNDIGDVFIAQQGNPSLVLVESRWDRTARAFPECSPDSTATGCTTKGGLAGLEFPRGQQAPRVDEVSLGLHREVAEKTVVGVDATYRRYSNLWVDEEINRIWDPTGTKVVGYVDGQPHTVYQVRTLGSAYRDYRGLDLWVQGRNGPWDLLASYTLGFNNGTVTGYFDGYGDNPRMMLLSDGPTPDDIRHTLKGAVGYSLPFGLDLNMRFQYRSGAPLWMTLRNPTDGSLNHYRSPRGTGHTVDQNGQPLFNDPTAIAELRQPDLFLIDASARYDLGRAFKFQEQKMELMLQVFNVLNSYVPRLSDSWAPSRSSYGLATGRQTFPLQAQLALRFRN